MSPARAPRRPGYEALIKERGLSAGDEWIRVEVQDIPATLTDLVARGFGFLCFLTCVDHLATPVMPPPPARFELVYELRNMAERRLIRVRASIGDEPPVAPSVSAIFPNANWDEREVYDLFGIEFTGHPDLTRILMPDDWVGHPLRRDYPVGGEPVDFSDDHAAWQTAPPEA
jgi:NADH-quinone oxidoreductase subunit C